MRMSDNLFWEKNFARRCGYVKAPQLFILFLLVQFCFVLEPGYAQTEEAGSRELVLAENDNEHLYWSSADSLFQWGLGGRFFLDAEYYFEDYTSLGNGATLRDVRLRSWIKFKNAVYLQLDVGFGNNRLNLQSVYLGYQASRNWSFRAGHFLTPFGLEASESSLRFAFIKPSATTEAFGINRRVGVGFRYAPSFVWLGAGFFGERIKSQSLGGDHGFYLLGRMAVRPMRSESFNLHLGGSFAYGRPSSNGVDAQGNDVYNRVTELTAHPDFNIDYNRFLKATVQGAKRDFRFGGEFLMTLGRIYIQGEYLGAHIQRTRNARQSFEEQLNQIGGWSDYSSYLDYLGELNSVNFFGYYAQLGITLLGEPYGYDALGGRLSELKDNSLELVLRYNHTNLNDVDGYYYQGGFYRNQEAKQQNNSIAGGRSDDYSVALNYYFQHNMVFRLNYSWFDLENVHYPKDKRIGVILGRIQMSF